MLIEFTFIVCLKISPDICEERSLAYLPEIGLTTCMMQAQPRLAEWLEMHPKLAIARWTCALAGARAVKA